MLLVAWALTSDGKCSGLRTSVDLPDEVTVKGTDTEHTAPLVQISYITDTQYQCLSLPEGPCACLTGDRETGMAMPQSRLLHFSLLRGFWACMYTRLVFLNTGAGI